MPTTQEDLARLVGGVVQSADLIGSVVQVTVSVTGGTGALTAPNDTAQLVFALDDEPGAAAAPP